MTDDGKKSIALGYALTYAAGISAFMAMSTMFKFAGQSADTADTNDARTIAFLAGVHFVSQLGYALCFVLLAATLDFLTKRSPQPMNALSLGLAAFATIDLLLQVSYLNVITSPAAMKP